MDHTHLRQFYVIGFLLLTLLKLSAGISSVALEIIPEGPQEGETVKIVCTVTEKSTAYSVYVSRQAEGQNIEYLVLDDRASPVLPDNVVFESELDAVETYVATLTIMANRHDAQRYTCSLRIPPTDIVESAFGSLVVYYQPDPTYPMCEIDDSNGDVELQRREGNDVVMVCTTEIGNPPVQLQWTRTSGNAVELISSLDDASDTTITATIIVKFKLEHDRDTFTCSFTNSAARSCSIGPFQVTASDDKGKLASTPYDTGMVVAIAILLIVVIVVVVVVIIAVLVKWGRCSCDNRAKDNNNRRRRYSADDIDSQNNIEMQTTQISKKPSRFAKKNKKRDDQNIQYSIEHVPVTALEESGYAYANDVEQAPNGSTAHDHYNDPEPAVPSPPDSPPQSDKYPPPPIYPSLVLEDDQMSHSTDDIKVVMDDELFVSAEKLSSSERLSTTDQVSQDLSIPSEPPGSVVNDDHGTGHSIVTDESIE